MSDATREILEELGFPSLRNEAGAEVPKGLCPRRHEQYTTDEFCSCSQLVQVIC
jgi:hypothetical protein